MSHMAIPAAKNGVEQRKTAAGSACSCFCYGFRMLLLEHHLGQDVQQIASVKGACLLLDRLVR